SARSINTNGNKLFHFGTNLFYRCSMDLSFNQRRKKISTLIIEDDPYIGLSLKEDLKPYGPSVSAATKEDAFKLINEQYFDIALVDLHLVNSMGGLELLSILKQKGSYIIVLSEQTEEDIIKKAYESGAKHFLQKKSIQKE